MVADPAVSDPAGGWSGNDTGGSGAHRGTGPVRGRADRRAFQGPRVCALRPGTPRVGDVCADLGDVAHIEVDLDSNPQAARRFSVLSLPTTLIFDVDGRQRYRTSGVPKAADLRSALKPLLA